MSHLAAAAVTCAYDQYIFHLFLWILNQEPDDVDDAELRIEAEDELQHDNGSGYDQRFFVFAGEVHTDTV
jgi:hypothetical protein